MSSEFNGEFDDSDEDEAPQQLSKDAKKVLRDNIEKQYNNSSSKNQRENRAKKNKAKTFEGLFSQNLDSQVLTQFKKNKEQEQEREKEK